MFILISMVFCFYDLSWSDYFIVMVVICGVIDCIGFFWYISDVFYDNEIV